jgi:hypothetical protein
VKHVLVVALFGLFGLFGLSACNPNLYVESPQPPGRSARVDEVSNFWGLQYYRMELSTGVAIALTCSSGAPCEHMKVVSDDPSIAEIRLASLGVLKASPYNLDHRQQTEAGLVVVGKAPGKTTLRVTAAQGHREVVVTVIPPPTAIAAAPVNSAR